MPVPSETRLVRRRPPRRASRVGSTLVGLGFLTVLAVAFFGGIVAGRHFPRMLPSLGAVTVPKEPRRGIESRLADRTRSVEPAPVLTFYQELTAPLTSPPPAPKPKPDRSKPFTIKSETTKATPPSDKDDAQATRAASPPPDHAAPAATDRVALPAPTPAAAPEPRTTRYTVQVGAFGQREQAEAIRARLAAAGHDAFVADLDSPAATRYRVRIGSYPSRDEARRAAERLTATERLSTYVTVR
jgi:cell division protein FtsN